MTAYLLRRLATGLLTLVVASVVVFSVLEILPGDPARLMLGFNLLFLGNQPLMFA
jgi:peptide/nickel transport system permease protein